MNKLNSGNNENNNISVAMQSYRVDVGLIQVILGNDALMKCDIPSFVTDFVSVSAWVDSEGTAFPENTSNGNLISND